MVCSLQWVFPLALRIDSSPATYPGPATLALLAAAMALHLDPLEADPWLAAHLETVHLVVQPQVVRSDGTHVDPSSFCHDVMQYHLSPSDPFAAPIHFHPAAYTDLAVAWLVIADSKSERIVEGSSCLVPGRRMHSWADWLQSLVLEHILKAKAQREVARMVRASLWAFHLIGTKFQW